MHIWSQRASRAIGWLCLSALAISIGFGGVGGTVASGMSEQPVKQQGGSGITVVIPVEQTIETGLEKFIRRAFAEAERLHADRIILEINTYGGRVDAAENIGGIVQESKAEIIAFVKQKAVSAGAFIALNADRIVMTPGSSIGSAAVVDGSGKLIDDPKTIGHWASKMRSAAETAGRNPEIAHGMVDKNIVVEMKALNRTKEKGDIISLSAEEAKKVGYADAILSTRTEVLDFAKAQQSTIVTIEPTFAEKLARLLTHPATMSLLFIVGIGGILVEVFVPGFGLPGLLGISSFGLYFFGHYAAGFAGIESVVLFVAGIVLLVLEMFIPSFGILGVLGLASIVGGVTLAAFDSRDAIVTLSGSALIAIAIAMFVIWRFRKRGIWNKFILKDKLGGEEGYYSSESKEHLVGKRGTTLSTLRPSGTAILDGTRYDVVTEGQFLPAGTSVVVVKTDGTRIVVKEASGTDL